MNRPWLWFTIAWILIALSLAFAVSKVRGQERIASAYRAAAGFLVLNYKEGDGVISEWHQVLYSIKRPILCEPTADYQAHWILYSDDLLVIAREPIPKKTTVCPDYDFIKRKCNQ